MSIFLALGCSLCWGVSYTIIKTTSEQLNTSTIYIVYSLILFLFYILYASIKNEISDQFEILITLPKKTALILFAHTTLDVMATFIFLTGYKMVENGGGNSVASYIALTSTYPMFVLFFDWILYKNSNYKFEFVIPGIFFIIIGIVLLSFSTRK